LITASIRTYKGFGHLYTFFVKKILAEFGKFNRHENSPFF